MKRRIFLTFLVAGPGVVVFSNKSVIYNYLVPKTANSRQAKLRRRYAIYLIDLSETNGPAEIKQAKADIDQQVLNYIKEHPDVSYELAFERLRGAELAVGESSEIDGWIFANLEISLLKTVEKPDDN